MSCMKKCKEVCRIEQAVLRKAKAVEIKVGDMVLNRNDRERGGTGKLKSYWEEAMFEVLEKKGELPVYKIGNVNKRNDIRIVHRNNLMKCEELPVNMFDETKDKKLVTNSKSKLKKSEEQRKTVIGKINERSWNENAETRVKLLKVKTNWKEW